jgi:hypothetical protein
MIKNPHAYRKRLNRRLDDAEAIVAEARAAADRRALPPAVAAELAAAAADVPGLRRRLRDTWSAGELTAVRRWCDNFARQVATVLARADPCRGQAQPDRAERTPADAGVAE